MLNFDTKTAEQPKENQTFYRKTAVKTKGTPTLIKTFRETLGKPDILNKNPGNPKENWNFHIDTMEKPNENQDLSTKNIGKSKETKISL